MVAKKRRKDGRKLRVVNTYNPATGGIEVRVKRSEDETEPKTDYAPPTFSDRPVEHWRIRCGDRCDDPEHWCVYKALRVARRDAHFLALHFRLINAGLEALCHYNPLVSVADLICAAADVASAAGAQWDVEQQDVMDLLTGEVGPEKTPSAFTRVVTRLEEMHAGKPKSDMPTDDTVDIEVELYRICGLYGLELCDDEMWKVYQRINRAIAKYEMATGDTAASFEGDG